jgi:two-component system phosphate regulon sensor histidine kinase PhoR
MAQVIAFQRGPMSDASFTIREKLLANALPDGIVLLDASKHLLWWNAVAENLLCLTSSHLGRHLDEIISSEELDTLFADKIQSKLELPAPHNQDIRLSLQLRDYQDKQFLLIMQDITHTYRLEKMRQDFVANVSHELRTPLTVFHGYLELLLSQSMNDSARLKIILQQMAEQSQRMERLVSDLLLLSRLESAEPDVAKHQAVDVPELIDSICQDAKSLSGERKHHFIIDIDRNLQIEGEKEELRSAFSNIVINAVLYTPANGTITVSWCADDKGAHFIVKDTGIGIAAKHIDRITQRFYRVDKARSREQGGTGLGLAIVKHVLLRHHGELTIQSEVDRGSVFHCTFPIFSRVG